MHGLYDGDFVGYKIVSPAELDTALREAVVAVDASVLLELVQVPASDFAGPDRDPQELG
jgi:hypothetical protein